MIIKIGKKSDESQISENFIPFKIFILSRLIFVKIYIFLKSFFSKIFLKYYLWTLKINKNCFHKINNNNGSKSYSSIACQVPENHKGRVKCK